MKLNRIFTALLCGILLSLAFVLQLPSLAKTTQRPFNLVAWDSGKYVQLNWDADSESTTQGYHIYRSAKGPDNWEKLNETVFPSTTFVDYLAPRSELVFYKVNSVNGNGKEIPSASAVGMSTSSTGELAQLHPGLAYDKNDIITDSQFTMAGVMSAAQIQAFLSSQGSVLANYSTLGKTAAQRIYDDCQTHGISPYVVLVTLQKEKGLIRSGTANPNVLAMGWNTSDSSTSDFANQIYHGTRQLRLYYENLRSYGWTVGQSRTVSDGTVTPGSNATAGLYTYTSWIGQGGGGQAGVGGNYLFWDLWYNTFAFTSIPNAVPSTVLSPVVGSLRVTSTNLGIRDGKWEFNQHRTGFHGPGSGIGNSNDTFAWDCNLYTQADGNADVGQNVYAVAEGDVVSYAGVAPGGSCNSVLIAHPNKNAPQWWSGYLHLGGRLVGLNDHVTQDTVIGTVGRSCANNDHLHFVVYQGQNVNGGLISVNTNITERSAVSCGNGSSENFRINGGPPLHPNGTLVKGSLSTVYLIRNGQKRGITSEGVLANLYEQSNSDFRSSVIRVAADELNSYPEGQVVSAALPTNGRNQPDGRLIRQAGGSEVSIVTNNGQRRPFPNQNVFLGLGYLFCNVVEVNDYNSYPEGAIVDGTPGGVSAQITGPTPGSTFNSSTVTFNWNSGSGVGSYYLYVGTVPAGSNVFNNFVAGGTQTVGGIPTNGQPVYVRLWSFINGGWQFNDYTYTAASSSGVKAQITSPTPGSTFSSSTVTFNWNSGSGVSSYYLYVGTSPGGNNIFNNFVTGGTQSVGGIPTNGQSLHVRLWSFINGGWQFNDYTYTAASSSGVRAQITSPTPGSTLSSSSVTFNWSSGSGVSLYYLYVGTSPGGSNIFNNFVAAGTQSVGGIPTDGQPVNVRLWSLISGNWQFNDYTYTAASSGVRAQITSPSPGSTFSSSTVTFNWSSGSGVSSYYLYVGNSPGGNDIFNNFVAGGSHTLHGIPTDGRNIHVRLWSLINGAWQFNDYTFRARS